jgi:hypothetical protein
MEQLESDVEVLNPWLSTGYCRDRRRLGWPVSRSCADVSCYWHPKIPLIFYSHLYPLWHNRWITTNIMFIDSFVSLYCSVSAAINVSSSKCDTQLSPCPILIRVRGHNLLTVISYSFASKHAHGHSVFYYTSDLIQWYSRLLLYDVSNIGKVHGISVSIGTI